MENNIMFRFIVIIIAIIILVFAISSKVKTNNTITSSSPTISTIVIEKNRFIPTTLTVSVGDNVTFINQDAVNHQITSDINASGGQYQPLNLGILHPIGSDGPERTVTFTQKGVFGFHDELNPEIRGKIIVK